MSISTPLAQNRTQYWIGAGMVFFGAIGFSCKAVFVKMAYRDIPGIDSLTILALRMLFSIPFYLAVAISLARRPHNERIQGRAWVWILFLGVVGYYAASYFDFLGLQYISASVERIILFIYPTMVLIMTAIFFKKTISKIQYTALIITYLGISLAFVDDFWGSPQKNLTLGAFYIFLSALTYAIYLVFSGEWIPKIGSIIFTCYAMLVSSAIALLHFSWVKGLDTLLELPGEAYRLGFIIAIISTVIPTFLTAEGINRVGSSNMAIIGAVGPIITIVLAHFFLNENISLLQIVGTIVVLGGVLMISWKGK
jgi:drug/metabolite transporter (DMT)-like permease